MLLTVSLLAVLGGVWLDALVRESAGRDHSAVVRRRVSDLFAPRINFARALCQNRARRRRQCRRAGLSLLLLLNLGHYLLVGWGSLWQWAVVTAGGAAATPLLFPCFDSCGGALGYQPDMVAGFPPRPRNPARGEVLK